jgi:hypothetical protein
VSRFTVFFKGFSEFFKNVFLKKSFNATNFQFMPRADFGSFVVSSADECSGKSVANLIKLFWL